MSDNNSTRILAIDPGTRYLGVAVLEGKDLIFATRKIVKDHQMSSKETLRKTEKIISELIEDYAPNVLAIEKIFFTGAKRSKLLKAMTAAVLDLAKQAKIPVVFYEPKTVRRFICPAGRPTKLKAAFIISTEHYPWLKRYYDKDLKKKWWQEKYWARMFDAISLGLTCFARRGEGEAA